MSEDDLSLVVRPGSSHIEALLGQELVGLDNLHANVFGKPASMGWVLEEIHEGSTGYLDVIPGCSVRQWGLGDRVEPVKESREPDLGTTQ